MSSSTLNITEFPVMESFNTIQGEGFHAGKAAYFVRLGGCDVGCHWCDVKESWNPLDHPMRSVDDIISEIKMVKSELVVITGGEPLMYDLTHLTEEIKKLGRRVHVETSGVYALSGEWEWICFSPKKFKSPQPEFYDRGHELKVVIFHESDFQWAEDHASLMNDSAKLFLQPEWSKQNQMVPKIVEHVKNNPKWQISLQNHKFMDIP